MEKVDIKQAKTRLSKLLGQAIKGEPFIITKAGKPLVKVTPLNPPTGSRVRRLGFMARQFSVPHHFDLMHQREIEKLFGSTK